MYIYRYQLFFLKKKKKRSTHLTLCRNLLSDNDLVHFMRHAYTNFSSFTVSGAVGDYCQMGLVDFILHGWATNPAEPLYIVVGETIRHLYNASKPRDIQAGSTTSLSYTSLCFKDRVAYLMTLRLQSNLRKRFERATVDSTFQK